MPTKRFNVRSVGDPHLIVVDLISAFCGFGLHALDIWNIELTRTSARTVTRSLTFCKAGFRTQAWPFWPERDTFPSLICLSGICRTLFNTLTVAGAVPDSNRLPNSPPRKAAPYEDQAIQYFAMPSYKLRHM